ncbi:hypothetical protein [Sphingomonas yabuuchiae]|uniref:hypothetical protein n=2 Tax=Sphingomonas TaxID=13687 RepID=UPI003D959EF7
MDMSAAGSIDAGQHPGNRQNGRDVEPTRRIGALFPDPLDEDGAADEVVVTTRRAIGRVALVATETATRFQRDAVEHDPMSWMFAPRQLFGGAAAVDACLDRQDCMRGILLHGLGIGLDADRSAMDELLAGDGDERKGRFLFGHQPSSRSSRGRRRTTPRARMYTATIVDTRDNRMMQVFHASIARDVDEVRTRLAGRFGPDAADLADIRQGVHVASPPVLALVPEPVLDLIRNMEQDCSSPTARHFAVDIEMGIQA